MSNEAEAHAKKPSADLKAATASAAKDSKASDSLTVQNFRHDDDSLVVVTSWRGSEPLVRTFESQEDVPADLAAAHIPEQAAKGLEASLAAMPSPADDEGGEA